jgi:hypothetical protein
MKDLRHALHNNISVNKSHIQWYLPYGLTLENKISQGPYDMLRANKS